MFFLLIKHPLGERKSLDHPVFKHFIKLSQYGQDMSNYFQICEFWYTRNIPNINIQFSLYLLYSKRKLPKINTDKRYKMIRCVHLNISHASLKSARFQYPLCNERFNKQKFYGKTLTPTPSCSCNGI